MAEQSDVTYLVDTKRIPALDGLRGIAILIVVFGHIALFGTNDAQRANPVVRFFADNNGTGVDLFFVLSGFLITGILCDTRDRQGYFRTFYTRRTLRIFPLYYSVLAIVAVGRAVFPHLYALNTISPAAQLANWTYTTNILMSARGWGAEPLFLGHFWSLAVEEQFYILWPLVVFKLRRETLVKVAVAGAVIALILRFLLIQKVSFLPAYMLLPARMDALLTGSLIALWLRGPNGLPSWITSRVLMILVFALFAVDISFSNFGLRGALLVFRSAFHFSVTTAAFGVLLVSALGLPDKLDWSKVFGARVLRFFGKYSYAIYVFHLAIIVSLPTLIKTFQLITVGHIADINIFLFGAIAIALTVGVSLISWNVLEQPFLKLKERVADNRLRNQVVVEA